MCRRESRRRRKFPPWAVDAEAISSTTLRRRRASTLAQGKQFARRYLGRDYDESKVRSTSAKKYTALRVYRGLCSSPWCYERQRPTSATTVVNSRAESRRPLSCGYICVCVCVQAPVIVRVRKYAVGRAQPRNTVHDIIASVVIRYSSLCFARSSDAPYRLVKKTLCRELFVSNVTRRNAPLSALRRRRICATPRAPRRRRRLRFYRGNYPSAVAARLQK